VWNRRAKLARISESGAVHETRIGLRVLVKSPGGADQADDIVQGELREFPSGQSGTTDRSDLQGCSTFDYATEECVVVFS
jgi:hypothetical protein